MVPAQLHLPPPHPPETDANQRVAWDEYGEPSILTTHIPIALAAIVVSLGATTGLSDHLNIGLMVDYLMCA